MRLYLDATPVIYAVEDVAPYSELVRARLTAPDVQPIASEMTRLECRVRPLRDHDQARLQDFDDYFARNVREILAMTRAVVDLATDIRAEFGFATPDAIHLAAAVLGRCDVFLTNDRRLQRFSRIVVEFLTL